MTPTAPFPRPGEPRIRRAAGIAAGVVGLLLAGAPGLLAAQDRPPGADALRAVETFDPTTDERTSEVMRPLTADERLRVEAALAAAGASPGEVDGRFDQRTRKALSRLQRRKGLAVCGCVDVATLDRLGVPTRTVMTTLADAGDASGRDVEVVYPSRPSSEPAARRREGRPGRDGAPDRDRADRPRDGETPGDRAARERAADRRTLTRRPRADFRSRSFFGFPVPVPVLAPPRPLPPRTAEPAAPHEAPATGRLPARPKPPRRVPPPR